MTSKTYPNISNKGMILILSPFIVIAVFALAAIFGIIDFK